MRKVLKVIGWTLFFGVGFIFALALAAAWGLWKGFTSLGTEKSG